MKLVGENIPHDSARGHVTGESVYIDDMPFTQGEVLVDFFSSPVAHGKIVSLDLEVARAIPGVIALYTYQDLDGHNLFGPIIQDEILLAEDTVTFVGQAIVVIAAESQKAMRNAKAAIHIEIEPLEPVFTIERAIELQQFIGETRRIECGDVEQAFTQAEHTLEGLFFNDGQEHFYLESQSALVYPGENDSLTVHSSTQNPTEVQAVIAEVLGLGFHQVTCITKRMGGGFGGKECQAVQPAALAALVAQKTKRPARIHLSVDDDMKTTGKRHAFRNRYKVAFTKDGLITALDVQLYSNGGAANDLSTAVMGRAMCHAENAYFIPNVKITGTVCKTNFAPNTAFRGFGGPQGMANMENILEEIAQFLGKDAYEIRTLNCYGIEERNVTPYGEVFRNNKLPEIFRQLHQSAEYEKRLAEVKTFNANSLTHLRGISMTPIKFGISFNTKFLNQANALVNIYLDGTVQVSTGATEMGQGVNTKIRQLVAEEFQLPVEWVQVMPTSTEKNNNTSATAASSGADLNGAAAVDACQKIKQRLTDFAKAHLNTKTLHWDETGVYSANQPGQKLSFKALVKLAYLERISLGERGFYATPGLSWDWATGQGNPFLYYTTGCAVSEVEIDRFTGDLRVLRSDLLLDAGRPLNPGIDRGQITGAFIQGMGWVTTEALRYTPNGELLTHSPTTYKIPNIQDVPGIFNIDWIENHESTLSLRGSKAVGEPPLILALSVWTAVKQALSFVSCGEIVKLDLPATNEEILTRLTHYSEHIHAIQNNH